MHMHRRNMRPPMRAAPAIEPTTIPAIAPPDNPFLEFEAPAAAVPVEVCEDEVEDAVAEVVAKVIVAVIFGRTTPAQRDSAFEL
jgi:hypothetical protein